MWRDKIVLGQIFCYFLARPKQKRKNKIEKREAKRAVICKDIATSTNYSTSRCTLIHIILHLISHFLIYFYINAIKTI